MVRPRFAKLPVEQQQAILSAAREEFAALGFHEASLNRVIEAAGISKGSLYYYFDDKADLFVYVTETELRGLFARLGSFAVPSEGDADSFWSTLERYYLRLMAELVAAPPLASLLRAWVAVSGHPALQQAQLELAQAVQPWMERVLTAGQRVGAVRQDLPSPLLIAVVVGMGQAMDTWMLGRPLDETELPWLTGALVEMIRGAVRPPA